MWSKMLKTRYEVLSEPDGLKWMADFEEQVLHPFKEFQDALREDADRREPLEAVKSGVAKFQAAVATHLGSLDEPI
jgi:hypothetical protein